MLNLQIKYLEHQVLNQSQIYDKKEAKMKEIKIDVLIIGAGPAGLAAGIYTSRAKKTTLILKGKAQSHLEMAHKIENYPGVESATGKELLELFQNQATKFGAEIVESEAIELSLSSDPKMVTTRDMFIMAKTIIFASGKGQHKKSIENEEEFVGRGVSYCASCDGAFFRKKKVVVYGHDEEAVDDAIMLKDLGCNTKIILDCGKDTCSKSLLKKISDNEIELIETHTVISINGSTAVDSITIEHVGKKKEILTDALFIIQEIPSATLLKKTGIKLTDKECIDIDRNMHTSIPGVFAAGDITCGGLQVAVAVGEGVTASLETLKYLRSIN